MTRKGYFQSFPHLGSSNVQAALFGIAVLAAATLTWIMVSQALATWRELDPHPFHCHPGDCSSINGRELCLAHGVAHG